MNQFLYDHRKIAKSCYNLRDFENFFDTQSYKDIGRPLQMGKDKKVTNSIKDETGHDIIKYFDGLGSKMYSYIIDNNNKDKKAKGPKNVL